MPGSEKVFLWRVAVVQVFKLTHSFATVVHSCTVSRLAHCSVRPLERSLSVSRREEGAALMHFYSVEILKKTLPSPKCVPFSFFFSLLPKVRQTKKLKSTFLL